MTKFSSFKEQQKLFENWRRHTEEEMEDLEDIETIIGNYNLSDVKDVLNCMERLISLDRKNVHPPGLKVLYQQVVARKQEEEDLGKDADVRMIDAYNNILTKIPASLSSSEEWGMNFTQTENWLSGEETINEGNNVKYSKLYENWNKHIKEDLEKFKSNMDQMIAQEEADLEKYAKWSRNDLIELIVELEEATVEQQQIIVSLESEIADLTGSVEEQLEEGTTNDKI